jgi:hypothetical protein
MNNFDKKMSEIFDIEPVKEVKEEKLPVVHQTFAETDAKQDLTDAYQQSKDNLQEFIDNGKEALEELIQIAKVGQHPRAFEVYSGLLKNLVDANKELLATQKSMRELSGMKDKATSSGTNIDKAIFVGSTTELAKLIKNGNKNAE